jgi:hypothetical protein
MVYWQPRRTFPTLAHVDVEPGLSLLLQIKYGPVGPRFVRISLNDLVSNLASNFSFNISKMQKPAGNIQPAKVIICSRYSC